MNDNLYIALQKAIDNLGTDVLMSQQLANILSDYGAFEIHDNEKALKKDIITTFVVEKYGEKLSRWKKKQKNWKIEQEKFISALIKKYKYNENLIWTIADAFAEAIGMPPINSPNIQQKKIFKVLFGDKIILQENDVNAIIAGSIIEVLILIFTIANLDGAFIIAVSILLLIHSLFLKNIYDTTNPRNGKHSGIGVTYAFLVGELVNGVFAIIMANTDISIAEILSLLIFFLFFSFAIGRSATYLQSRLFGYTLASIFIILFIFFSIPSIVKQHLIGYYEKEYEKNIELRDTHLQQNVKLGFMGINIGDYYPDVIMHMKKDSNVVKRIRLEDKKPGVHNNTYYKLDFDKELQYDVIFYNDTIRLYILFYRDTVKHIQINIVKTDLYIQKYGDPESYYTRSPEKFVYRCSHYPYYEKITDYIDRQPYATKKYLEDEVFAHPYLNRLQWTFSNGIIRITEYCTQYISNDVFDSINVREERKKQREKQVRHEREILEREHRKEKERKEQEQKDKREQEQRRIEEVHKEAIKQI